MSSQANTNPNDRVDPNAVYRIPQRANPPAGSHLRYVPGAPGWQQTTRPTASNIMDTGRVPDSDQNRTGLNPMISNPIGTELNPMATNPIGTGLNPMASNRIGTGLNPLAHSWTGTNTNTWQSQVTLNSPTQHTSHRGVNITNTQDQSVIQARTRQAAITAAEFHNRQNQPFPGSTLRPRSPGYVNPELVAQLESAQIATEQTRSERLDSTNHLFARGFISPEIATEQWRRQRTDPNQTDTGPPNTRNPYAYMNEMQERQKLAAKERHAAMVARQHQMGQGQNQMGAWQSQMGAGQSQMGTGQSQMGQGPTSPMSARVWNDPQIEEREHGAVANVSGYQGVPGEPHLESKVWVNPEYSERDNWARMQENLKKSGMDKSPFVPKTFGEYLEHRAAMTEAAARDETRKLNVKKAEKEGPQVPIAPAMMGKKFGDNRGAVTSMETIWSPDWKPTTAHPQAKWPVQAEMKEEGDERHTSGFGRFPALPRVPGNETVGHKVRSLINPYELDKVAQLQQPAYENDIPEPVDMDEQKWLLGDLLDHIDQFGDDPKPEEEAKGKEKEKEEKEV